MAVNKRTGSRRRTTALTPGLATPVAPTSGVLHRGTANERTGPRSRGGTGGGVSFAFGVDDALRARKTLLGMGLPDADADQVVGYIGNGINTKNW